MPLCSMEDEYLSSIHTLKRRISELETELINETNFELKRKIRENMINLDTILSQTIQTYQYICNYYNKNSNIRQWI